jgi:hypothetical protein
MKRVNFSLKDDTKSNLNITTTSNLNAITKKDTPILNNISNLNEHTFIGSKKPVKKVENIYYFV